MRPHGATLRIARHLHPFSGHRDQLAAVANSDVVTQLMSARAEGTRFREGGELLHFGRIAVAELDNLRRRRAGSGMAVLTNHLQQRGSGDVLPAGARLVRLIEKDGGSPARTRQPSERCVAFIARLVKGAEGSDFPHESSSVVAGLGEMGL